MKTRLVSVVMIQTFENQSLMKILNQTCFQRNFETFKNLSAQLMTNFKISGKDYQVILRNNIGRQMEELTGFNPFVSKKHIEKHLKQDAQSDISLTGQGPLMTS